MVELVQAGSHRRHSNFESGPAFPEISKIPRKFLFWNNSIDVPEKIGENPESLGSPTSGISTAGKKLSQTSPNSKPSINHVGFRTYQ